MQITATKTAPTEGCTGTSMQHSFHNSGGGPSARWVTAKGPNGEEVKGTLHQCYFCLRYVFVPLNEKFINVEVTIAL